MNMMTKMIKHLVLFLALALIPTTASAYNTAFIAAATSAARHHNTSNRVVTNRSFERNSISALVGKEVKGCKIIDAFYWDHKINIICIKDGEFLKGKVQVKDWEEECKSIGRWTVNVPVDIDQDVLELLERKNVEVQDE